MSGEAFEDAQEQLEGSLEHLLSSETMRWIFVGGKGGVGKTTTACSLAIELAQRRDSVLLISTDPAHNISDALCQKFNHAPYPVKGFDNLFAMELDPSFSESLEFRLKQDDGLGKMMKEMVNGFPGVDEAMGFAELMQMVDAMPYSVIVFDTAPTGHTLRLLGFPDLLDRGLLKLGSLQSKFGGLMQMMQAATGQEIQEEDLAQKVSSLHSASNSVKEMFSDPTQCTFVCVCIPEFLSVYETERLIQELCKHGIDTSSIVVNQVLFPEDCGSEATADAEAEDADAAQLESLVSQLEALPLPQEQTAALAALAGRAAKRMQRLEKGWDMCQKKRRMQSKYLSQIQDLYADDFHIVAMPMLGEEVRGLERLRAFAEMLRSGGRALPTSSR